VGAHHDVELVDRPVRVEVQEVAALDVPVADVRLKDDCVIVALGRADLSYAAPIVEDPEDGGQDSSHRLAAVIGLEHDGAAKGDVAREQSCRGVGVPCFQGVSKSLRGLRHRRFLRFAWLSGRDPELGMGGV
jgi:hypothetical protein